MRREKLICTEIVKGINARGGWAYKIPDFPSSKFGRFNLEKPCDIVAVDPYTKKFLAIEVKVLKQHLCKNPLRLLRPNQLNTLMTVNNKGGISLLAVCYFIPYKFKEIKYYAINEKGEITNETSDDY
jgi:hypothetical protein